MARILKRNFNGGPLDGEQRMLNSTVTEWCEVQLKSSQSVGGKFYVDEANGVQPVIPNVYVDHRYKLGSDAEFHYKGVF